VRFPESWSATSLAKKRCLGTAQDKFALDRAFSLIEGHPPSSPIPSTVADDNRENVTKWL
jgi:hypothetical protein